MNIKLFTFFAAFLISSIIQSQTCNDVLSDFCSITEGETTHFRFTGSETGASSYFWDFGDGNTSTLKTIDKMKEDGTFDSLSKRERLQIDRQRAKLELNLGSIVKMTRMPEAIFVIDINKESISIAEANHLGIRTFAMTDTNTNPKLIDFPIPSNDDAKKSIECIVAIVKKAIAEGLEERGAEQDAKDLEKKEKAKQISEEK